MAFLKRLIMGSGPAQRVDPTDEVLPVFWLDSNPLNRDSMMSWTLRFDKVLDADKLHHSLNRLLEKGGWRKLGGRMRLNADKGLELHVPRHFSPERPAVNYYHDEFDVRLADHKIACKLPDPGCLEPTLFTSGPGNFTGLAVPPGSPQTLDDLLTKDIPAITLYIVSFTDETLVSICWNHVVSDAMGMSSLARAWSLVLSGRDDEVLPMASGSPDLSSDPMSRAGLDPSFLDEKYILQSGLLTGFSFIRWVMRIILDALWWPKMEYRTIMLPTEATRRLKQKAMEGLTDGSFVSTGDAVTAWLACITSSLLGTKSGRTVSLLNVYDVRGRAPSLFGGKRTSDDRAYVQNMTLPTFTLLKAQELLSGPGAMVTVASKIRQAILTQTTEGQVHALAKITRNRLEGGSKFPALVAETDSLLIVVSNWTKANFFKVFDFGDAVVRKEGTAADPCHPVYYHSHTEGRFFFCLSGTSDGKYWIDGSLPPVLWPVIEKELAKI